MLTPTALVFEQLGGPVPDGYVAVSLCHGQPGVLWGALRLAVIVRTGAATPDSAAQGPLVVLRELLDARVFLGCYIDGGGCVQQWVELWVQEVDGLADALPRYRETLTNQKLDERWAARFESMACLHAARGSSFGPVVRVGWETSHPAPLAIDVKGCKAVPLCDANGGAWSLCTDDGVLAQAGLPVYSSTLHRYLHVKGAGDKSAFVAVTQNAPETDRTTGARETLGVDVAGATSVRADLLPFNVGGGLMMVCPHAPLSYEAYVDALSGLEAEAVPATAGAATTAIAAMAAGTLNGASRHVPGNLAGGLLTLGRGGRAARLLETLHLKLRVLSDAFAAVGGAIEGSQLPFLNVTGGSFRVRLNDAAWGMPSLWTAQAVLAVPGEASAVDVAASDLSYVVSAGRGGPSVYSPGLAGQSMSGVGTLQIRAVRQENGQTTIEATLRSQDRLSVGAHDLIWLRVGLGAMRIQLWAMAENKTSTLASELRLRSLPQRLTERETAQLKTAEGVVVQRVDFETLAQAGPACDLYALAVLAARTLLVDGRTTLPVAWDELGSLAGQVAEQHDGSVGLGLRIRAIFESGDGKQSSRWLEQLGPQRLTRDQWDPRDALAAVTPEVWYDVLASAVRCITAAGPDSVCRDFGVAPPGAIHRVFERACEDWRELLIRTRGLLITDHGASREVHQAVARFLAGTAQR